MLYEYKGGKQELIERIMKVADEEVLNRVREFLQLKEGNNPENEGYYEDALLQKALQRSDENFNAGRVHNQQEVESYFANKKRHFPA